MTDEDKDILAELKEINRLIRLCSHPGIDRENLAQDIWLEIHTLNLPLSYTLVRNRCLHEMRKHKVRYTQGDEHLEGVQEKTEDSHRAEKIIAYLMDNSDLTSLEQEIVYRLFYEKETKQSLSEAMSMSVDSLNKVYDYIMLKLRFTFYKDKVNETFES